MLLLPDAPRARGSPSVYVPLSLRFKTVINQFQRGGERLAR